MNIDLLSNWNIFDRMIYAVESACKAIRADIKDSRSTEPDVETIIAAETEYLQRENENLKKREIPLYLIEEEGQFFCPKCKEKHSDPDIKYCSKCGHRVIRNKHFEKGYGICEKSKSDICLEMKS